MLIMLIPLIFAVGALLAAVALAITWRRYGRIALANLEALRTVRDERDFVVTIGHHPTLVGSTVRRWPHRPAKAWRRAAAAGLRAAA
jgi:hypothetical protein